MKSIRESDLIDTIYSAVAAPDRWPEVLVRVSDWVSAVGGMIAHCATRNPEDSFLVTGRLSDECNDVFLKHHVQNPWAQAMDGVPFGQAVIINSRVDKNAVLRTAFYADVLAPQGLIDTFCFAHRAMCNEGMGGFSFTLSEKGSEKAGENLGRLQRLVPHLGRALDVSLEFGRHAISGRQIGKILDLMSSAAFLLNGRRKVTYANARAEALLRSGDGLVYEEMQLKAAHPDENAAFINTIVKAISATAGNGRDLAEPLRLTRPSGKPALLMIPVPLPPPSFELWQFLDHARLLLIVKDPADQATAEITAAQAIFGLTSAEARVAVLVGAGLSGPQAAQALGLSITTVKTHLAHSFEKIGINSQAALVKLMAALPIDPTSLG